MVDNKIMCHFGGEHLATMQRIINNKFTSNQLKCCICQNQKGYPDSKTDMKITIKIDRDPVSGNLKLFVTFYSYLLPSCACLLHKHWTMQSLNSQVLLPQSETLSCSPSLSVIPFPLIVWCCPSPALLSFLCYLFLSTFDIISLSHFPFPAMLSFPFSVCHPFPSMLYFPHPCLIYFPFHVILSLPCLIYLPFHVISPLPRLILFPFHVILSHPRYLFPLMFDMILSQSMYLFPSTLSFPFQVPRYPFPSMLSFPFCVIFSLPHLMLLFPLPFTLSFQTKPPAWGEKKTCAEEERIHTHTYRTITQESNCGPATLLRLSSCTCLTFAECGGVKIAPAFLYAAVTDSVFILSPWNLVTLLTKQHHIWSPKHGAFLSIRK